MLPAENLCEEHQNAAVNLTLWRHEETRCCHCGTEDEQQQRGCSLHHASPKADRMAVMVVRMALIITAQVFLVCCVMTFFVFIGSTICVLHR